MHCFLYSLLYSSQSKNFLKNSGTATGVILHESNLNYLITFARLMTSPQSVKHFTKALLFITICCACAIGLLQNGQQYFELNNLIWLALLYYLLLSYTTFRITHSSVKKDNKTFITRVYSAVGIRIIFSLFPLLIYLLFSPHKELPFIAGYLLMYLLFTSFEIYFVMVNLRPDSKKPTIDAKQ